MIQTFGPYAATAGTVIPVTVRTDATWIYVYNDSPLSLLVSLADAQPAATDSLGGAWNFAVRPHSDPVVPVQTSGVSPLERETNGIAQFNGHVWILPRDPGGLATNGLVSTRAEVFITIGGPYDAMPAPSSTGRQTDLASQPRVITVPVRCGAQNFITQNFTANGQFAYLASGAIVAPPTGPSFINIYLHDIFVRNVGAGSIDFQFSFVGRDSGGVEQLTEAILYNGSLPGGTFFGVGLPAPHWGRQQYGVFGITQWALKFTILSISAAGFVAFSAGYSIDDHMNSDIAVIGLGGPNPFTAADSLY